MTIRGDIPASWAVATFEQVCGKCEQRVPAPDESFTYIDIGSVDRERKTIVGAESISGANAPSRARKQVLAGDVLVSMTRPNLNAVALVSSELDGQIASTGFEVLRPAGIVGSYIFYVTRSQRFVDEMNAKVQGALYPAVKSADVREFQIPLPSFAEQKQIAAKLDELLAQVDTLKARLGAVPAILKRFRQSVLAAAVCGRLTEDWRDGEEMTWTTAGFGELVVSSGNGISKRRGDSGTETTVLRLADFKDARRVFGNERKIHLTADEVRKYALENGDLIAIRVNGSAELAGKFILYGAGSGETYCDHFIRFRVDRSRLEPKFFMFVANEGEGRRYLRESLSTSAGQNTINQQSINGLQFALPPIEEQAAIIRRVDQLFAFADQIEQRVKAAQARVNHLTQAILAKAFRGELTAEWRAQNPDLISGENSAEALLVRIRAARATAAKPRGGRYKTAALDGLPMVAEKKAAYKARTKRKSSAQA